jgi:hypothetical protein
MRSCAIQLSAREEHSKRLKVATFGVGEWHGLAECERVRVHDMKQNAENAACGI